MDIDQNLGYFYEGIGGSNPTLTIDKLEFTPEEGNKTTVISDIPGGIGGRAVITQGLSGNMLTADVLLGTDSQMSGTADEAGKVYAGFSASGKESDAGVSYTKSLTGEGRWRANMLVYSGGSQYHGTYKTGYNAATYKNGFKPGGTLSYTLWKNYSDSTISNAMRLKVAGYAVCADANCNNTADTYLTSIIEAGGTNVGTLSKWKLLATVAGSEQITGKSYGRFTNIKVDGTSYTPIKDAEDNATVSISGNSVTISVSR